MVICVQQAKKGREFTELCALKNIFAASHKAWLLGR